MDDFDFEAPSFSLGIDLDDADLVVEDSDPETTANQSFKRNVRRRTSAAVVSSTSSDAPSSLSTAAAANFNPEDEDIEDFSSQDDDPDYALVGDNAKVRNQAMCSTSTASLRTHGSVVVNKSMGKVRMNCHNEMPRNETNHEGWVSGGRFEIPKLTISPVRKFILVESDSDDFVDNVKMEALPKRVNTTGGMSELSGKKLVKESSSGRHQNDDLWNDFLSPKSYTISTPALDEVCEEYFETLKEINDGKYLHNTARTSKNENITEKLTDLLTQQNSGLHGGVLPAHRYFFHNDMRVQNLVRSRLPNFCPLAVSDSRDDNLLGTTFIDYRSQFDQGGASTSRKSTNQKTTVAETSTKGRRKKKNVVENGSHASESWVNPRVSSRTPKDASQRRVRADGSSDGGCPNKSTGHWFTDSGGKRVYVSSSGKELTGRMAYMHYKKESGSFKKSRKKAATKKK